MKAPDLPRGRRGAVATVAALVVLAACTLVTIAALQIHAGHDTTVLGRVSAIAGRLRTHSWTDQAVLITAIGCAVLGLALLAFGLLPARRALVRLADLDASTLAGIARPGLVRDLGATAGSVDGIIGAKVRVRRSRVRVRATSALRDRTGLPEAVRTRVEQRLADLAPVHPMQVRVRITGSDR